MEWIEGQKVAPANALSPATNRVIIARLVPSPVHLGVGIDFGQKWQKWQKSQNPSTFHCCHLGTSERISASEVACCGDGNGLSSTANRKFIGRMVRSGERLALGQVLTI